MSVIEWIIVIFVVLVAAVVVYKMLFGGEANAIGYTRGYGYCPNMGACTDCDVCEED